nr:hypothetical protein [Roseibium aggregatum]
MGLISVATIDSQSRPIDFVTVLHLFQHLAEPNDACGCFRPKADILSEFFGKVFSAPTDFHRQSSDRGAPSCLHEPCENVIGGRQPSRVLLQALRDEGKGMVKASLPARHILKSPDEFGEIGFGNIGKWQHSVCQEVHGKPEEMPCPKGRKIDLQTLLPARSTE